MTDKTIMQICFGMGVTQDLDPNKPKPRSLKFTMMRNCRYMGYAYISPDHPDPQAEALRIGKSLGCDEAWHGSPSDLSPLPYISET